MQLDDKYLLWHANKIRNEAISNFQEYATILSRVSFKIWTMTSCAGKAFLATNVVKLSRAYYTDQANFNADFKDTVLHELAHIIAWQLFQENGHGPKWKKIAIQIGCNGERCHELKLAKGYKRREITKRFLICTPCKRKYADLVSRVHMEHVISGCYRCKCGKALTFLEDITG